MNTLDAFGRLVAVAATWNLRCLITDLALDHQDSASDHMNPIEEAIWSARTVIVNEASRAFRVAFGCEMYSEPAEVARLSMHWQERIRYA